MSARFHIAAAARALVLAWVLPGAAASTGGIPPDSVAPKLQLKLQRNPFETPVLASVPLREVASPTQAPPPWAPLLKATVVSTSGPSLVNVDGQMIEKGDDYQGYRLVDVREREAVFERGGNRWVLSLD